MAALVSMLRVSARQSACWRECVGCGDLAPLAPDETHCSACPPRPQQRVTRRRLPRAA